MMIKISGSMMSVDTQRTMLTAYEKEVSDLEFEEIKWQEQPEHLVMNPFGMMPVMVDGTFTLSDSRAIMRYVDAKFEGQGTSLSGSTPEERALVDQWTAGASHRFNDPWKTIMDQKRTKLVFSGLPADETVVKGALEKMGAARDVYDRHLTKKKYLAGDFFSLADVSHLPMFKMLGSYCNMLHLVDDRPHVKAWWARITARPSWQKTCEAWQHAADRIEAAMKEMIKASFGDTFSIGAHFLQRMWHPQSPGSKPR